MEEKSLADLVKEVREAGEQGLEIPEYAKIKIAEEYSKRVTPQLEKMRKEYLEGLRRLTGHIYWD